MIETYVWVITVEAFDPNRSQKTPPPLEARPEVAFTLGQNTPCKMVVIIMKTPFFIYQIAKSTAYYAA